MALEDIRTICLGIRFRYAGRKGSGSWRFGFAAVLALVVLDVWPVQAVRFNITSGWPGAVP